MAYGVVWTDTHVGRTDDEDRYGGKKPGTEDGGANHQGHVTKRTNPNPNPNPNLGYSYSGLGSVGLLQMKMGVRSEARNSLLGACWEGE